MLERYFHLEAQGATVRGEIRAGTTTFLTMAYILFINPAILMTAIKISGGADVQAQLLSSTALAAAFGCLMMGLIARYPFALAPGMGLNAYFAFTVVGQEQIPWQTALGAVFISGLLFLVLSVTGARTLIIEAIPAPLRRATTAGIGLFLAFIGLQNAGIVVKHPATLVTMGDLTAAGPALALLGLLIMAVGVALSLRGAILIGIVSVSLIAVFSGAHVFNGAAFGGLDGIIHAPVWPSDLFLALDLQGAVGLGLLGVVFIFFFVDLFDTAGTLIGLSERGGFADKDGLLPRSAHAFTADALATTVGALLGTSTTTAYIESAAGISEGGRTGLTALIVGGFFLLSLFLWPLMVAVPAVATAPALIIVGATMMSGLRQIEWGKAEVALPAFLTAALMPLTFSIANGISLGIISWAGLRLAAGRGREVHPILYGLSLALIARYLWLSGG